VEVTALLTEGLRLMAIGMGIVFAFLLLLVGVMRTMSAAVMRFAPEPRLVDISSAPILGETVDAELISVIAAAVARHRRSRHPE